MDNKAFRNALGAFATGVTIVTTRSADGTDVGVTANSFNSVSLDPPMVLWSLAKSSGSLAAFTESDYFAVHILASDQEALSNNFAKRGVDKFAGLPVARGMGEAPLLEGCSARFQCKAAYRYEGGDHVILVGEVLEFEYYDRRPLAFLGGRYAYTLPKASATPQGETVGGGLDRSWLNYLIRRASHQFESSLRPLLLKHGLNQIESHLLHVLIAHDGRSLAQFEALLGNPQVNVTEIGWRLASLGLIQTDDPQDKGLPVRLTEAGRALTLNLMAAAKSLEDEAEAGLESGEVAMLKELLWKVIRNTNPGAPRP